MQKKKANPPKQVVYLLGAGATHAEIRSKGETFGILMQDIKEGILNKIDKENIKDLLTVKNELVDDDVDVEHLITLYESTGTYKQSIIAKKLKKLFIEVIREKIRKLESSERIRNSGERYTPKLLTALVDMHQITALGEHLKGIITLNYEDLLERAIQEVVGGIDYVIQCNNKHSNLRFNTSLSVLKLHGSFNWKNEFPITLIDDDKIKNSEDVLWIPPGVEKRREKYPFSIIWGKAREMLDCDILRVIGCSLSRNDWELVSLLYTTQKLNINKRSYDIELIDYFDVGKEKIKKNYSYLSFRLISEIKEVRDFLIRSYLKDVTKEDKLSKAIENYLSQSNPTINIFETWLRSKGEDLKNRDIVISTPNKYFEKFINEV